ncbi:MAG: mercuric reductase [Planctomycetes bacterium]|nr:mercuric reductase [Planctomycetota bacterium]
MPAEQFEFAIVGGGKGGKSLAMKLASAGRRVVMVERGMIGGTCINVACIPTKTMVKSAKVAELAQRAAEFGIRVTFDGASPEGVRKRKRDVVASMVARNQAGFDRSGMTLLIGDARFTGPKTFEVKLKDGATRQITAEKVFINTGTRPSHPAMPGLAEVKPLDSESVQELDRLPEHLIILGAGYIGCEFAQVFRRFGSRVTLIERGARFLPREDADIANELLGIFAHEGIEVVTGATVGRISGESGKSVKVTIHTESAERTFVGSDLVVAIGRVPNTEELNLAATGVETDSRGFVKVNAKLETTAANVWALGDVNGGPQFTHASFDDYRIVYANLNGGNRTTTDRMMPYSLFTDPELGRVGLTEEEARKQGRGIKVAKLPVSAIPRAVTMGETRGLLKAVIDADTNKILGVSVLAAEGGEIMATVQIAMLGGLPYTALRDVVLAHPTMVEGLNDLFARVE